MEVWGLWLKFGEFSLGSCKKIMFFFRGMLRRGSMGEGHVDPHMKKCQVEAAACRSSKGLHLSF